MIKQSLKSKVKLAFEGMLGVLAHWKYTVLFVVLIVACMQLVYWFLNLGLAQYLLFSDLSFGDKMSLFGSAMTSLIRGTNTYQGAVLLALIVLQALALTILVFILRRQTKVGKSAAGGVVFGSIGAVFGLGCAACGTSLVLPIISLFVSGSAYAIADTIGVIITTIAVFVVGYSIYRLGYAAYPLTK